jgi:hypothetical protein
MRPHAFNPFSFCAGVALIALGIAGFAGSVDLGSIDHGAVVPIVLLAIAVVIITTLRRPADKSE